MEQNECEQKALKLMQIASKSKLTWHEEIELNKLDKLITTIMLKAENNIKWRNNTYPWSPKIHEAVRKVSIWKTQLTQYKTKVSHLSQIEYLTKSMKKPIDTSWIHPSELKRNLRAAIKGLKIIRSKATEIRKLQLTRRASAMNIANKSTSEKVSLIFRK